MNTDEHRCEEMNVITERIIGCALEVSNKLGCGFLEKVYENALAIELRKAGIKFEQQSAVQVKHDGAIIGDFTTDILVEGCVLVELKAARNLDDAHLAQCLNYLKATGLKICLLLNFGKPKLEIKRVIF
jgi:GxxExxY protein